MPDPALPSLLSRIEAATGADREIDADVAICLLGDGWRRHSLVSTAFVREVDGKVVDARVGVTPVSSSVDAVLALIERELPGWHLIIDTHGDPRQRGVLAQLYPPGWPHSAAPDEAWGFTIPLALLAALVRAKNAQTEPAE